MSTTINSITYTVVSGFASVTASSLGITTANIQSNVTINDANYSVTIIGINAFKSRPTLTSVTIPNSVTSIGNDAFAGCSGLTSLTIPSSVTSLGHSVFANSGLTSITIPNTVTSMGLYLFYQCYSLISVTLPNNMTIIKERMFQQCLNLTSITIPSSVTTIDTAAFFSSGLSSIHFILPSGLTRIGTNSFQKTKLISVNIPEGVTAVQNFAFNECYQLTSVTIPSTAGFSVGAFKHCTSLTSVTLYNNVASSMFQFCTSLISVNIIGNRCNNIADQAFSGCTSLTSINIPSSVRDMSSKIFQNCTSLTSVNIASADSGGTAVHNAIIGDFCFDNCTSLTSITIPNGVSHIYNNAFSNCTSLISVIINNPANISYISANSFTTVSSNITSSIKFYNTGSLDNLSAVWKTISGYYYTKLYDIRAIPDISFYIENVSKTIGDPSFQIDQSLLSSNSSGSFTITSSNTSVATISGNTVTMVGTGSTNIIVTQEATASYTSKTIQKAIASYTSKTIQKTFVVKKPSPIISNFSIPTKSFGDNPFVITDPSSNSSGSFSYSSSNTSIASIFGNTITIVGGGTSIITLRQAETTNYSSATSTTNFVVNKVTPTISNFSIPTKSVRNTPFVITNPSSNSSGSFSYSSSNSSVATISGNIITIVSTGSSTITATQNTTSNYFSATSTTIFVVNEGIPILNFYLSQLDVSVNSLSASLLGETSSVFSADATVVVDIPLENAMNIFQFQTDSTDINNVTANDIKYKVVYTGSGITDMAFNIDTSGIVIDNSIHSGAANNNATYDYVRYLSLKLFNTHLGVDLFSNESDLRQDLRDAFSTSFDSNMTRLHAVETDASGNSPSKTILNQIINNHPERLNDIASLAVGNNWFKCPLVVGDILYFRLTVKAAANQNTVTNVVSIPNRVYLIKVTLIS